MKKLAAVFLLLPLSCVFLLNANANGIDWHGCSWGFGQNKSARNKFYDKLHTEYPSDLKYVYKYTVTPFEKTANGPTVEYFNLNILKKDGTKCDTFGKPANANGPFPFTCKDEQGQGCHMSEGCAVQLNVNDNGFPQGANYTAQDGVSVEKGYNMTCAILYKHKDIPVASFNYDLKLENPSSDNHSSE